MSQIQIPDEFTIHSRMKVFCVKLFHKIIWIYILMPVDSREVSDFVRLLPYKSPNYKTHRNIDNKSQQTLNVQIKNDLHTVHLCALYITYVLLSSFILCLMFAQQQFPSQLLLELFFAILQHQLLQ